MKTKPKPDPSKSGARSPTYLETLDYHPFQAVRPRRRVKHTLIVLRGAQILLDANTEPTTMANAMVFDAAQVRLTHDTTAAREALRLRMVNEREGRDRRSGVEDGKRLDAEDLTRWTFEACGVAADTAWKWVEAAVQYRERVLRASRERNPPPKSSDSP